MPPVPFIVFLIVGKRLTMAKRYGVTRGIGYQHGNSRARGAEYGVVELLEKRVLLSALPNLANVPYMQGMGYQLSPDSFYMPSGTTATAANAAAPVPPPGQRPFGAQYADGSEFMSGDVYVTVVLLQSDGTIDPQTQTWTPTEIGQVKTRITEGLTWWQDVYVAQGYTSPLKFTVDFTNADTPFKTSYEPIDHPSSDQYLWIDQYLASKGPYSGYDGVSQFNDVRRLATRSDWSYTVFVVDSSADADGSFTDGYSAYAYLGGPFVMMTYDNGGWGINSMGMDLAHETGHIFYALDEYYQAGYGGDSYFDTSGYYNVQNTNAAYQRPASAGPQVDSLMGDATMMPNGYAKHTSSPSSLEMIGWRDTDSDSIIDVLDQPLSLTGTSGTWNWGALQYSFSGTSAVQTLPNLNPKSHSTPGNDITLNEVDYLQYRIDGGSWIDVNATPFKAFTKTFTSQVIKLPYFPGTLDLRTYCADTGATSAIYAADISNHPPTDIALSNASLPQNRPAGTIIGSLSATDSDAGDSCTYSLVAGAGSGDNASFAISGNQLQSAVSLAYQPNKSYTIRVRARDLGGLSFERIFAITVNDAPTAIALNNASVPENQPTDTIVSTLSSTDPNIGDAFTYSLVSGAGANDNASFTISGKQILTSDVFDYEAQNTYSVRIRTTDAGGLFVENMFSITVTDVNDSPSGMNLSKAIVPENQPAGTVIGALSSDDQDVADTFAYTLVPGAGGSDNARFTISGNQLLAADSFDYESKNTYSIRLRTIDAGGLTFEKAFTVGVKNVNEAPTDAVMLANSVAEHRPAGTVAAALATTDEDTNDAFVYSLVDGEGSDDNSSFVVDGNTLVTTVSCNYETKDTYWIRVRTTDSGGLSYEKAVSVNVTNINEWPTGLALSSTSIPENQAPGTTVGILEVTDPDLDDTFTYSVAPRIDGPDCAKFTVVGNELKTASCFDFDSKRSYAIRARVVDQNGLYYEKAFVISVTDLPEFGVMSDNKVRSLKMADTDGDQITYSLIGGGTGTVQPDQSLTLAGMTAKSVLTINVARKGGGNGRLNLSGIFADGWLKKISGKSVIVSGHIAVAGSIKLVKAGAAAASTPSSPAAESVFASSRISAFGDLIAPVSDTLLDSSYQAALL